MPVRLGVCEHILLKKGGALFRAPRDLALVADAIGARIRNGAPIRGVVVSALYGATDDLYRVAADPTSLAGREAFARVVDRYTEAARHCAGVVRFEKAHYVQQLSAACAKRNTAAIVALGEKWAAQLFTAHLSAVLGDERVVLLDPCDIITVLGDGYAHTRERISLATMRTLMRALRGTVLVMGGFHGSAAEGGGPTLMYRNGNDVSVGLLAQVLNRRVLYLRNERVTRVEKVTATPGILSIDPVFGMPGCTIPYLTHTEALEGAQRAEFVHEMLLDLARTEGFDVYVTDRSGDGTLILPHDTPPEGVKRSPVALITGAPEVDYLKVTAPGSFRVSGLIATLHEVLDERRVNIHTAVPGTSSHAVVALPDGGLRFTVADGHKPRIDEYRQQVLHSILEARINARMAKEGLRTRCKVEYAQGKHSSVTVVGSMAGKMGTLARIALAHTAAGVNIDAVVQCFGESNVTTFPARDDFVRTGEALHEEFFLQ